MLHCLVNCFRGFELVGARQEVNGHRSAWLSVEPAERVVILRTEFNSSDIFDSHHGAGGGLADNDVVKFFGGNEPAGCAESFSELLVRRRWRPADLSCRRLQVLFFDRSDDIGRSKAQLGKPIRFDPDAHSIVGAAKEIDLSNARDAKNLITQVDATIVDQKICVVSIFW